MLGYVKEHQLKRRTWTSTRMQVGMVHFWNRRMGTCSFGI